MQTPSSLEARFERDGFTIVKEVITPKEVLRLRAFLEESLDQHLVGDGPDLGIQTGSTACAATWPDFYQRNPQWFGLFCNKHVTEPLRQLLGDPFVLSRDSIAHWDYYPQWHTDTTTSEAGGRMSCRAPGWRMITVGLYLQSGGSLSVSPGSHRRPDPFVVMRKTRGLDRTGADPADWTSDNVLDLPIDAGDAVIFDMRLIHRAARTLSVGPSGEPCKKLAVYSRVSRNIPEHLIEYSDFQINGAGSHVPNIERLRQQARPFGCVLV